LKVSFPESWRAEVDDVMGKMGRMKNSQGVRVQFGGDKLNENSILFNLCCSNESCLHFGGVKLN
jgi:hypothetical protein